MKTSLLTLLAAVLCLTSNPVFAADKEPVEVRVNLANPNIPALKKHTNYLKVALVGVDESNRSHQRPPVNVGIVLDRSGSMQGDKMKHAREAAIEALKRLSDQDIVSVIAFDSVAEVIVPATKLTQRDDVIRAIQRIDARDSTALFAGVSKAAEELRKFKTLNQINRIVLLSDGAANIGPSNPDDLGRLGASLAKESISVTTIGLGLGYNEKLMAQLAQTSDGNHAFINNPAELAAIFTEEFGDIISVVAQELRVKVRCAEGVRPVRVLGRSADIRGDTVEVAMNQLRTGQEKFALIEVELPAGASDSDQLVGDVEVSYRINDADKPTTVASRSVAHRVAAEKDVAAAAATPILIDVAKLIGVENQMRAVQLSDEGKIKEAEQLFLSNAGTLQLQGQRLGSKELLVQGNVNLTLNGANNVQGSTWQSAKLAGQTFANITTTQNLNSNAIANTNILNAGQSVVLNSSIVGGTDLLANGIPPQTVGTTGVNLLGTTTTTTTTTSPAIILNGSSITITPAKK